MADNHVALVGTATRDPELRYTATGKAVANFGLAINRRVKDADGTWKDGDTSFFDITAWDTLAENIAASILKGSRVMVQGRLQQRSWETDEGDKRSKVDVTADEIGPSLRWAQADVTKNEREKPAAVDEQPPIEAYTEEEPF